MGLCRLRFLGAGDMSFVPTAHARQNDDRDQGGEAEQRDALLAGGEHYERGQQRAHRGSGVAAYLEQRLRETVASAGG